MPTNKRNQSGFSIVETLLVIVAVVLVAFIGYYVWHAKQVSDKTLASNSSATPKFAANSVKTFDDCKKAAGSKLLKTFPARCVTKNGRTFTDTSQSAVHYVTIKEWGVRAAYSGKLTLEYTSSGGDSPAFVRFSSAQLDDSTPLCKQSPEYGGIVDRYSSSEEYLTGDDGVDSGKTAEEYAATLPAKSYGHVGDYYFFYQSPQAACGDSQASQDLQSETQAAVRGLLPELQTAPSN